MQLASSLPIADLHIDYAMPRVDDARDLPNLPQVHEGTVGQLRLAVLSIWHRWPELLRRDPAGQDQRALGFSVIRSIKHVGEQLGPQVECLEDLADGGPRVLHHLEGADYVGLGQHLHALEDDLRELLQLGVRSTTPIYSGGNQFGGGSNQVDGPERHGLTGLGRDYVYLCAQLGIAIDTAHMNVRTREDVIRLIGDVVPLAYTHGALDRTVRFADQRPQQRGIPLEQADELRRSGGIVGLSVSRPFFHSVHEFDATLDALLSTPLGARGVGIGTDFGGVGPDELLPGLEDHPSVLRHLEQRVVRGEVDPAHLRPILVDNALDYFARTLKTRAEIAELRLET